MSADTPTIVPVVLSGGAGTRLWPASREQQPKQLLPLIDTRSMIHATIDRVSSIGSVTAPIVVTNAMQAIPVERALRDAGFDDFTLILEPFGRNTAPAVAVAALEALHRHGDALVLVLPADHAITEEDVFVAAVGEAARAANDGYLVTFGITPTTAETGYGYIRSGDHLDGRILRIDEFKEKPDAETAEAYVSSGAYSWNSGMFIFRATRYLEELESFRPAIATASRDAHERASRAGREVRLDVGAFAACPSDSVDFAVMEHTDSGAVLPVDPGWSDVGSWASLWDIAAEGPADNVTVGDTVLVGTQGSYVRASSRVIAAVGLRDVVIVDTPDALLVASRDATQDVRLVVDHLRSRGRPEVVSNGTEFEAWGTARLLDATPGHRTHLVEVDGHAEIPPAVHDRLSQFWQVVVGSATITIGNDAITARPGDSVEVPAGAIVSVANPDAEPLVLIRIAVDTVVNTDDLADFAARLMRPS